MMLVILFFIKSGVLPSSGRRTGRYWVFSLANIKLLGCPPLKTECFGFECWSSASSGFWAPWSLSDFWLAILDFKPWTFCAVLSFSGVMVFIAFYPLLLSCSKEDWFLPDIFGSATAEPFPVPTYLFVAFWAWPAGAWPSRLSSAPPSPPTVAVGEKKPPPLFLYADFAISSLIEIICLISFTARLYDGWCCESTAFYLFIRPFASEFYYIVLKPDTWAAFFSEGCSKFLNCFFFFFTILSISFLWSSSRSRFLVLLPRTLGIGLENPTSVDEFAARFWAWMEDDASNFCVDY